MSDQILVTGAAGGAQGSTGRLVASLLLEQGIPVRALVHKLDARSDAYASRARRWSKATSSAQPQFKPR
jgi:uncharacterized protein YbjT (DUF2867 family)